MPRGTTPRRQSPSSPDCVKTLVNQKEKRASKKTMGYIVGEDRGQEQMLPPRIEEYVGANAPVRFIDAFVEQLDFAKLKFERAVAAETGRPGYSPADLLKLYAYGYLQRIRSSRRLSTVRIVRSNERCIKRQIRSSMRSKPQTCKVAAARAFRSDASGVLSRRPLEHQSILSAMRTKASR